ncbi:MAG: hypothetical protein N2376_05545, partial [Clostridia bacterium]|nr:hypothetical protein [Clostridia bacterium]
QSVSVREFINDVSLFSLTATTAVPSLMPAAWLAERICKGKSDIKTAPEKSGTDIPRYHPELVHRAGGVMLMYLP